MTPLKSFPQQSLLVAGPSAPAVARSTTVVVEKSLFKNDPQKSFPQQYEPCFMYILDSSFPSSSKF